MNAMFIRLVLIGIFVLAGSLARLRELSDREVWRGWHTVGTVFFGMTGGLYGSTLVFAWIES